MAEFGSRLASLVARPSFVAGHPSLAALLQARDALASYPLSGVNVHTQPDLSQAWLQEQTIEPVPFGSFADPVSQLAFLMAPGVLRGLKGTLEAAATPGPGLRGLVASERGNLGPPPVGAQGEVLPESVVRDAEGRLQRLYHGTNRVYPDFEMSQASSGAGGDLYGKGIYMTENPQIAQDYATMYWHPEAKDAMRSLQSLQESKAYYAQQIEQARTLEEVRQLGQRAAEFDPLIQQAEQRLGRWVKGYEHLYEQPANIRPVYADLKQPFAMDKRIGSDAYEALGSPSGYGPNSSGQQLYENLVSELGSKEAANQRLAELGYDGITHMGGAVTGGQPHRVYISFTSDNVYPSFNVDALRQR